MSAIPIYVSNSQGLIWTVEDIAHLRTTHHITGSLVGTLPSAAQQNVFLGLPLVLAPEEVVWLVEEGHAYLVDERSSYPPPTPALRDLWERARQEDIGRQVVKRVEREGRPEPELGEEALRRREERERRRERERAAKAAAAAAAAEAGEYGEETLEDEIPRAQEEEVPQPAKQPAPKDVPHWVNIPSSSLTLPWYTPRTYTTLPSARAAGLWSYPRTAKERAKCAVFRSLHSRGYFLGPGLKFGGDWLVYPGDPLRYHSHFVATALPSGEGEGGVRPMEIIAFGRLGTATRKAHLLCTWEEGTGEVRYYSVEWANFG